MVDLTAFIETHVSAVQPAQVPVVYAIPGEVPCEKGAREETDAVCPCCKCRCLFCHRNGCTAPGKCCAEGCGKPGVV